MKRIILMVAIAISPVMAKPLHESYNLHRNNETVVLDIGNKRCKSSKCEFEYTINGQQGFGYANKEEMFFTEDTENGYSSYIARRPGFKGSNVIIHSYKYAWCWETETHFVCDRRIGSAYLSKGRLTRREE